MKIKSDTKEHKESPGERSNTSGATVDDDLEIKSDAQYIMFCVTHICFKHFKKMHDKLVKQIAFSDSDFGSDNNDDNYDRFDSELKQMTELAECSGAADALCELCNELESFREACFTKDGIVLMTNVENKMKPYLIDVEE